MTRFKGYIAIFCFLGAVKKFSPPNKFQMRREYKKLWMACIWPLVWLFSSTNSIKFLYLDLYIQRKRNCYYTECWVGKDDSEISRYPIFEMKRSYLERIGRFVLLQENCWCGNGNRCTKTFYCVKTLFEATYLDSLIHNSWYFFLMFKVYSIEMIILFFKFCAPLQKLQEKSS